MTHNRSTQTVLVVVVTAAALAGCTAGTETPTPSTPVTATTPVETPTVEVTPTPTPEPTPDTFVPEAGAVLTAEQAERLPEGTLSYRLADGTLVAVVTTEPVPQQVIDDVQAAATVKYAGGVVTSRTDAALVHAQNDELDAWMVDLSRATNGRTVFVVVATQAISPLGPNMHVANPNRWAVLRNSGAGLTPFETRDEAVAAANEAAANVPGARPGVVFVLDLAL